jgi:hypothetical protein
MIGFISTLVTSSLNTLKYSAMAELHNLQFTVAHALGFSVSTSRLLTTVFNTETSTSNHYKVFLLFRLQSLWNLGTKTSSGLTPPAYDWLVTAPELILSSQSQSQSQSNVTTDGKSASLSWNKHPSGAYDQIFITVRQLRVCWCGALSLTRGRVCRLTESQSAVVSLLSVCTICTVDYSLSLVAPATTAV